MIKDTNSLDTALLVFARRLVEEMRYINYPKEWSQAPLKGLLPKFFDMLNYHPQRLGDVIKEAYNRTFPEAQNGNINQLGLKFIEPAKDYELFAKTRKYFLDEYEITQPYSGVTVMHTQLAQALESTYDAIINTFAQLTLEQENEHRTLERICFALEPLYVRLDGMAIIGRDLAEYADHWRNLSSDERVVLKDQLKR